MIRTAVTISGNMRTWKETRANFLFNLIKPLRELGKVDIFLSTWSTVSNNNSWAAIDKKQDESDISFDSGDYMLFKSIEIENFDLIKDNFNLDRYITQRPKVCDKRRYSVDGAFLNYFPMMHKIYRANELKRNAEKLNNRKYDLVIRTRPDLIYPNNLDFNRDYNKKIWIAKENYHVKNKEFPSEDGWNIPDLFACSNSENMDYYSSLFLNLGGIFNNGMTSECAERMLGYWLSLGNFSVPSLVNDLPILR